MTPLELFFDLVFVLAITQCTALMAASPTWEGLARGLLVLGVLWWCWVGYSWLTSVIEPEEGGVRIAIFAAMAALLVVALSVPEAFDDAALPLAGAYAAVRGAQVVLLVLAGRDDPGLRRASLALGVSTAIGTGLLVAAGLADGVAQGVLWAVALTLDMAGPLFIDPEGWRLAPSHFVERHGLIVIIALGESIVAIGIGAEAGIDLGVAAAAVLGIAVACALWWLYFDVVARLAEERLTGAPEGRVRNAMARDGYSYLHFPMVAGIVLIALGMKTTLVHVGDPLEIEAAVALLGGTALYLAAHVAFRLRVVRTISRQRLLCALAVLALLPAALELPALATLGLLAAALVVLIAYEVLRFAATRECVRHEVRAEA